MAHFAEVDKNNIVVRVLVVDDSQEHRGQEFLANDCNLGGTWLKTSYNTRSGKRFDPETNLPTNEAGFRKNFAGIGFIYDSERDAFIPPKPKNGDWVLNEESCTWVEAMGSQTQE